MEKIVQANGVPICTEAFGRPDDPPLLLIMGAMASMVWWPDEFCRRLAAGGRYVIRYDNRDTGRSITYPPGKPGYSIDDLTADAAGVLDAYSLSSAHVAGMSLGGMIAQIAALRYPGRVSTLTLISSSVFGPEDPALPPIAQEILEYHASGASIDWTNQDEAVPYMAGGWRLLSGSAHTFEEAAIHAIASAEFRRANNLPSMFNHALLAGGEQWYGRMGEIRAPTLIIHGTEDPVLPYAHALALTRAIPRARLLTLEGTGHELHREDWDIIIDGILRHSADAAPQQLHPEGDERER